MRTNCYIVGYNADYKRLQIFIGIFNFIDLARFSDPFSTEYSRICE